MFQTSARMVVATISLHSCWFGHGRLPATREIGCGSAAGVSSLLQLHTIGSNASSEQNRASSSSSSSSISNDGAEPQISTGQAFSSACSTMEQYSAASNMAYEQFLNSMILSGERKKMERYGWQHIEEYKHDDLLGSDSAHYWKRKNECILAFRGTDNPTDVVNDFELSSESYYGIDGLNSGIIREFGPLLDRMLDDDKPSLKDSVAKSCNSSFIITGHSLGGALGQLFAVLVNKRDDPLAWPRKVDALYLFGSMPIAQTRLRNDKRADGCFPGASHYNVMGNSLVGDVTDFAYDFPPGGGFKHVYVPLRKVEGSFIEEVPCNATMDFSIVKSHALLHAYIYDCED